MSKIDVEKVQNYYDSNTSIFLKVGRSKERQNIHRQIWKNGIKTEEEATTFLNKYIYLTLKDKTVKNVCDLGCGVGATLFYLGNLLPKINFLGISISPEQIKYANHFKKDQETNNNCHFRVGDFHKLPKIPKQDFIYAIESFVHADRPSIVFEQAAKNLTKGGTFILIDDTLGSQFDDSALATKTVDTFKNGWHLGQLLSVDEIQTMASLQGLRMTLKKDYTKHIKLWRPRDYFIHFILFFYNLSPFKSIYFESLKGGDALQRGLKKRWIEFKILHFEKE